MALLGYVRLVVGEKGKVIHVCPDSLYVPEIDSFNEVENMINEGQINQLDPSLEDVQVIVTFKMEKSADESTTSLVPTSVIVLQDNFKEFWQNRINMKIQRSHNSLRDEVYIQNRIELWEDCYKDTFAQTV